MPAKDIFHNSVRVALEKDGWSITDDPLYLRADDVEFFVDLGAERILGAEKNGQKIAVEIKSFLGSSEVSDFHSALGQAINYSFALRQEDPDRVLYVAIARDTYDDFFSREFVQKIIAEYQIKLLIFNPILQEVILWKE